MEQAVTLKIENFKKQALNCVESLLIRDEISIDVYEVLNKVVKLLDESNCYDLKEGIKLILIDCSKED